MLHALVRPCPLGPAHLVGFLDGHWARRRRDAPPGLRDLQLTQYDEHGWRATFYTTGMDHWSTRATGTAWEPMPWRATQRAAWEALDCASP